MFAIYKKEMKSYFHSVIGCLFMAVLLFFIGLYFTVDCLVYGTPYFTYVLNSVIIIFLFAVPILTMKILSEERHQKTDQLLFTAPVKLSKIIIGKYLALLSMLGLVVLVSALYPLLLSFSGSIPVAETYYALFAFFLFGAACIAIGMFISAITESQVIAAVLTFAVLLIGFMMSGISGIVSTTGNWLTKILSIFDLAVRFDNLMNGIVDVNCMLYYFSVIVVFLFLTYQLIQKRRWTVVNYGVMKTLCSAGFTMGVIAVIAAVNIAANYLPECVKSFDITDNQVYSITDTTKKVLDGLQEDITVYLLSSKKDADITIDTMLKRYQGYSDKIKVEYKDQKAYPNFVSGYTSDTLPDSSIIVTCGDKYTVINHEDCFASDIDYSTYQQKVTGYDGEGQLTSAIAYVTSKDLPKVYVITGHQELALSTKVLANIKKENVEVKDINLMNYDRIPEDAASIIISGPVVDYSADDTEKVKKYLAEGGHAVILTAMSDSDMPNFKSILSDYGVTMVDGAVFEADKNYFYQYPFYILPEVRSHAITADLYKAKRYILMPQSVGFQVPEEDKLPEGVHAVPLLVTSDSSYSKTNVKNMATYNKEEGDIEGPFDVGVYLEKKLEDDKATKIAAFGCEYLLDDEFDSRVSGSNLQLFANAVSYLVEHEESVSIPVKNYQYNTIMVNRSMVVIGGLVITLLIPLMILISGILVWAKRRKK